MSKTILLSRFTNRTTCVFNALACYTLLALSGPICGQSFGPCGSNICASSGANVGIGTISPTDRLTIASSGSNTAYVGYFSAGSTSGVITGADPEGNGYLWNFDSKALYLGTSGTTRLYVDQGGSVGIGTTNPQHLLHVAGTIGAEQVIVSSTGADYVFDPSYQLQPLSAVADYIKQNHHLPEIPSAAEVTEKGLDVGEMQTKLLAKIEELTLHVIDAEERNATLDKENREIREKLSRLEDQVTRLTRTQRPGAGDR